LQCVAYIKSVSCIVSGTLVLQRVAVCCSVV